MRRPQLNIADMMKIVFYVEFCEEERVIFRRKASNGAMNQVMSGLTKSTKFSDQNVCFRSKSSKTRDLRKAGLRKTEFSLEHFG